MGSRSATRDKLESHLLVYGLEPIEIDEAEISSSLRRKLVFTWMRVWILL